MSTVFKMSIVYKVWWKDARVVVLALGYAKHKHLTRNT